MLILACYIDACTTTGPADPAARSCEEIHDAYFMEDTGPLLRACEAYIHLSADFYIPDLY